MFYVGSDDVGRVARAGAGARLPHEDAAHHGDGKFVFSAAMNECASHRARGPAPASLLLVSPIQQGGEGPATLLLGGDARFYVKPCSLFVRFWVRDGRKDGCRETGLVGIRGATGRVPFVEGRSGA